MRTGYEKVHRRDSSVDYTFPQELGFQTVTIIEMNSLS